MDEHDHRDLHPSSSKEQRQTASTYRQIAKYSQIGFMLPAAVLVGWLIGAALDKWLGTTWLYLAGLVFGIVAGFVQLFRMLLSAEKEGN